MLRRVGAVIFGGFAGFSLFAVVQGYLLSQFPPPEGFIPQDVEASTAYFRSLPDKAFMIVLAGQVFAAFSASFLAAKIADKYKFYIGLLVGGMFVVAVISYIMTIPTPKWVLFANPIGAIIAMLLGSRLALGKKLK